MTHTAAPAPTAPATVAGIETQEVTMSALTAARAALLDVETRVALAMGEDDESFDEALADEHAAALAAVRAAEAAAPQVKAVKWVVYGRRFATRRAVKWVGLATSRDDALAQAKAKWAPRGEVCIDQVGEAIA